MKNNNFYRLGKYFGYPDCCIKFFEKRVNEIFTTGKSKLTIKQQELSDLGTGFIPCEKCAEKINKETLHKLIKNRICKNEFPIE